MGELFLTVLNMSLTASYVILFVIIIRLLIKKAPKFISYALWGVVAFRLIFPFSFESIFSLLPHNTNVVPITHDIIYQQSPRINSGIEVIDSIVSESLPPSTIGASVNPIQIYMEIGGYIWVFGIVALLIYSVVSVLKLERQLKSAQLIEKNIYEAENLKTPFVLGLARPKIYLPVGLNDEERSYILLHEQTHIHRKDHIIKILAFLVLSIHWFNPLVWISFMLMSTDMELSCDERVLKEINKDIKKPYANSLLSLATGKLFLNGSPLAFGEGNVKGRIKNVLNYKRPRFWVIALSVIIVTAVGIGLMANPEDKNSTKVSDDSDGPMKHIQVEITQPGSQVLTGVVVTDKDGYKAGDIITVAIDERVSYDVASIVVGDWIDINYSMVKEKDSPEFVATHVNRITGLDYPTTFMLIENGDIIKSNTLRNSRVASEMPALILSGSPDSSLRINGVPDSSRYLKIDIGSLGNKIYYTFEKDGSYYVGHDDMHEISRETFEELMQYVYKSEIIDKQVSRQTTLEPTAAEFSIEQTVSVDMVELDYASNDIVIFHDYFGLFVYDLNSLQIIRSLDLKPLNCHQTQGDNYCDVSVSIDGNTVQLHPMSSENMFVYTISDNTLQDTAYMQMENSFKSQFVPIEEVINSTRLGNYSHHAVHFDTAEYGYLHTEDGTIGTLSYVRGDMVFKLFDIKVSLSDRRPMIMVNDKIYMDTGKEVSIESVIQIL